MGVVIAMHVMAQVVFGRVRMGLQDGGVDGCAGDGDPADDIGVDALPVRPIDLGEPITGILHRLGGVGRRGSDGGLPAHEEEGDHGCGAQQEYRRCRERDARFRSLLQFRSPPTFQSYHPASPTVNVHVMSASLVSTDRSLLTFLASPCALRVRVAPAAPVGARS